jgi:hypothetical protein
MPAILESVSTSRKKRKRYRAREKSGPEATAQNGPKVPPIPPRPWGLLGEGTELTRGDLALIRLAVNSDWPVSRCMRRRLPKAIFDGLDQLDRSQHNYLAARWSVAACRVVLAMSAGNIRAEHRARALVQRLPDHCKCGYCEAARRAQARWGKPERVRPRKPTSLDIAPYNLDAPIKSKRRPN